MSNSNFLHCQGNACKMIKYLYLIRNAGIESSGKTNSTTKTGYDKWANRQRKVEKANRPEREKKERSVLKKTERKKERSVLRKTERRLESVLKRAPISLVDCNKNNSLPSYVIDLKLVSN